MVAPPFFSWRIQCVLIALLLAVNCYAANPNEFLVLNYDRYNNDTADMTGRLFVPTNYDSSKSYPLVVFYHGAGETGYDNTSQVNSNINNLLAAAKNRDFFLYAPQAPSWWSLASVDVTMRMTTRIQRDYNIDTSRTYVTGLSMGGGGTWYAIGHYGEAFAAAVPICGVADSVHLTQNMPGKPIWAYHAVNDGTVSVAASRNKVNAIRAADGKSSLTFPLNNNPSNPYYNTGSPYYSDGSTFYQENNLRYTEYSSGGHGIWGRVYNEQPMYDWLFSHTHMATKPQLGEQLLFDFGATTHTTADSQGRLWNSTEFGTERTSESAIAFAMTSEGRRTPVNIYVSDTFAHGATNDGATTNAMFDPNIAMDSWITGSFTNNALAQNEPGIIVIEGLTPQDEYRIELFASILNDDGGRGRMTRYAIGDEYRDLNVAFNLNDLAVFESVFADLYGNITLKVTAAAGTTSRQAHLGAMMIMAVPEPASLMLLVLGLHAVLRRHGHRRR